MTERGLKRMRESERTGRHTEREEESKVGRGEDCESMKERINMNGEKEEKKN